MRRRLASTTAERGTLLTTVQNKSWSGVCVRHHYVPSAALTSAAKASVATTAKKTTERIA